MKGRTSTIIGLILIALAILYNASIVSSYKQRIGKYIERRQSEPEIAISISFPFAGDPDNPFYVDPGTKVRKTVDPLSYKNKVIILSRTVIILILLLLLIINKIYKKNYFLTIGLLGILLSAIAFIITSSLPTDKMAQDPSYGFTPDTMIKLPSFIT